MQLKRQLKLSLIFMCGVLFISSNVFAKDVSYYGWWKITRKVATGKIYALSDEEAKTYIGKRVFYSKKIAKDWGGTCINPIYKKMTETREYVYQYGKLDLKDIGINEEKVTSVEILPSKKSEQCSIFYGNGFYIKDEDTIIIGIDGVMFEMKKVKEDSTSKEETQMETQQER